MKKILIHLESGPKASVFDQIAAYDAGADIIIPYGAVTPDEVQDLVYGAMFTRGGDELKNSAIFIGGTDVVEAEEIFERTLKTFFGPLRVSVMFDANGSNTTAATAVAKIMAAVKEPAGKKAVVLAGTGPVGVRAAILLAEEGLNTYLSSRKLSRAEEICKHIKDKYGVDVHPLEIKDDESCKKALEGAAIAFCTGKPGVQLVKKEIWSALPQLEVLADINAVDPAGAEGLKVTDDGKEREGKIVFGPIGIGNSKMKVQYRAVASLFTKNDLVLDFKEIYKLACEICGR